MSKKIAIIGSGGFATEVLWLINEYNSHIRAINDCEPLHVIGFITSDTAMHGKKLCEVPVLGSDDWLLNNRDSYAVCAIANSRRRIKVTKFFEERGVKFLTVIHPSVQMSKFVKIGIGSIICAGTIMTTDVEIGNHAHINLNVTIGHNTILHDFVTIYPGVNVSGNVRIGYGAELGTNSTVIQCLKIGRGAILGAGAVVSKDIEENVVAVGIPAKPIRKIDEML